MYNDVGELNRVYKNEKIREKSDSFYDLCIHA